MAQPRPHTSISSSSSPETPTWSTSCAEPPTPIAAAALAGITMFYGIGWTEKRVVFWRRGDNVSSFFWNSGDKSSHARDIC